MPEPPARPLQRAEYIMGTLFTVQLPAANSNLFTTVFERLRAYDQALSDYLETSELNRVLAKAETIADDPQQSVAISPILCQALIESRYYQHVSAGAFNIGLEPLMQIWGFKSRDYRLPTSAEIKQALQKIHPSPFELRAPLLTNKSQPCQFRLLRSGTRLDFGAIGKGLALDAAMHWIKAQGVAYAAIDAGGSTQIFWGSPPQLNRSISNQGWPVRLRVSPDNPARELETIDKIFWLQNQAISSSNQVEQSFEIAGQVYGHIIDPRTGYPANPANQITVIAPTATQADAISTVLLLSPPEQDAYYQRLLNLQILRY